jgi:nucleoid-associated protein YgaU
MFASRWIVWLSVLVAAAALALSAAHPSRGSGAERRHVVEAGETLWQIAEANYAGDVRAAIWRIQERNGLAASTIQPGETLVLPP